jgi:hypothetical protein
MKDKLQGPGQPEDAGLPFDGLQAEEHPAQTSALVRPPLQLDLFQLDLFHERKA